MNGRYFGLFKDERSMWLKFYTVTLTSLQYVLWVVWFGFLLRRSLISFWISAKNGIVVLAGLIMTTTAFFSEVAWRNLK